MDISKLSEEDMGLISGCFLFNGMDRRFIRHAVSDERCTLESYPKGDIIYDITEYRRNIGLILEGGVEAVKIPPSGGRFVMRSLAEGSVFGAAAMFNDNERYVTRLTASSACRVLFFPQEQLLELMQEEFSVAENYIAFLSDRIHFLNGKISGLLISGTESTLRHWLAQNSHIEDGKIIVKLDVSISDLASMLHMGRASLYRSFDELEREGFIKKEGRRIEILCPEKLLPLKE
ncbi:MAG: Crp/Fnr family transcriptional regulator [Oscillospiraceae bacterium]